MLRKHWRSAVYAALALTIAGGLFVRAWRIHSERARPLGKFTASQILPRVEPIFRAVAPGVSDLKLTAEKFYTIDPDAGIRHHWRVECHDAAGNLMAHLDWDADADELVFVGSLVHRSVCSPSAILSPIEARVASAQWLGKLGIASEAHNWRVTGKALLRGHSWFVDWAADGRRAYVLLDSCSGAVLSCETWPVAAPPAATA